MNHSNCRFNTIYLAWDIITRFARGKVDAMFLLKASFTDFLTEDEEKDFTLLREAMRRLGSDWGELPIHGGMALAVRSRHITLSHIGAFHHACQSSYDFITSRPFVIFSYTSKIKTRKMLAEEERVTSYVDQEGARRGRCKLTSRDHLVIRNYTCTSTLTKIVCPFFAWPVRPPLALLHLQHFGPQDCACNCVQEGSKL
ncbi:hypothetical protein VP01_7818g1 [Puccinia sorghi]|uniref:Uncharacterized protein n=1 Tax=Puccinia sorghi TaxID=27349 RepID=A0A0L6UBZ5_9BASI|nr:hypothetical protein VP01_7818g1 [Puccinia sorghi]